MPTFFSAVASLRVEWFTVFLTMTLVTLSLVFGTFLRRAGGEPAPEDGGDEDDEACANVEVFPVVGLTASDEDVVGDV